MSQTYHLQMDNDVRLDVRADSAGEAMYLAIHRVRGHCVRSCHLGDATDPGTPLFDGEGPGKITFEVPHHGPLPFEPTFGRQRMCAAYVRAGDVIEDGPLSWEVHGSEQLPVKVVFEVREAKSGRQDELAYHRDHLLWVDVRGSTFEG